MKKIYVKLVPSEPIADPIGDYAAVVIDVLRATSCILTMLKQQAEAIIPFEKVEEVQSFLRNLEKQQNKFILTGERKGVRIDGFDFGNSPVEFNNQDFSGKSVLMCTTNGTKALKAHEDAETVYVASFLNADAIARSLEQEESIVFVCAGDNGQFSLADAICAGMIISLIKDDSELSDSAKTALAIYESFQDNFHDVVMNSYHGQKLLALSFGERDISFCLQTDQIPYVVCYSEGKIYMRQN